MQRSVTKVQQRLKLRATLGATSNTSIAQLDRYAQLETLLDASSFIILIGFVAEDGQRTRAEVNGNKVYNCPQ